MLILLCILVVLSSKASEAVEHHYMNASDLNLLEAHEAEASLAGRGAYTLMVGLTLIQTAAAKVAALQEFAERKDNGKMTEGSKERKKQEIRTHNAQLHAVVYVAGVAAAVAAIAALI
ncbi:hypothetical protein HN51_047714 [Arachis hypogaea]